MKKLSDDYLSKFQPIQVKVDGSFEDAFRRFKQMFQKEGVLGILKEKSRYEKPSEKKRRKTREAEERRFLLENRERLMKSGEWEKRQKQKQAKRQKKTEDRVRRTENE
jgi:small subunit ribosomal protein S21